MKLLLCTLLLCLPGDVVSHNIKRSICTITPNNDPLLDDVPNILAALQECGDTGRIVIPLNQTFNIRSPLDLSLCQRCDFQINGILRLSSDWDYWEKQAAVFRISNTTNIMLDSDGSTGLIDGNNFGWAVEPGVPIPERMPKLFSISDDSYQVHIRDLKIRNVPGTVFHVTSGSSAVRIYDVEIETAAHTAYLIEGVKHVYLWNNTIRATEACVAIAPNATNIQVEETRCLAYTREGRPPSGIELRLQGSGTEETNYIRNTFVKRFEAIGWMNVIGFIGGDSPSPQTFEIHNATFTDVTFGRFARQAAYLEQRDISLSATDILFRNFVGTAQRESNLTCAHEGDVCDFKAEGWNVTITN
ncbi:pectin lyase-like protein [Pyrenochaeta sp. DS3sAY3a]|nr:pectin lyase-like protein [Pyrenochaeta sp. DS3sAY3a]